MPSPNSRCSAISSCLLAVGLLFTIGIAGRPAYAQVIRFDPEGRVELGPRGDRTSIYEVAVRLRAGAELQFSFAAEPATAEFRFNIHTHLLGRTEVLVVEDTTAKSGVFVAPSTGDYFPTWENTGFAPARLRYRVLAPAQRLSISASGTDVVLVVHSNAEVSHATFDRATGEIRLIWQTPFLTGAYARLTVPADLLDLSAAIRLNDQAIRPSLTQNATHVTLLLEMPQGTHELRIQTKQQPTAPGVISPIVWAAGLAAVGFGLVLLVIRLRRGVSSRHARP